jgi:hypothetical protein
VSRFVENAANLLDAAESAVQSGHTPSHLTILLGCEGGIRMIAESDWPLDSLQTHHGAKAVYRISEANEKVRVEGREGGRTCVFETPKGPSAARLILGGRNRCTPAAPAQSMQRFLA